MKDLSSETEHFVSKDIHNALSKVGYGFECSAINYLVKQMHKLYKRNYTPEKVLPPKILEK